MEIFRLLLWLLLVFPLLTFYFITSNFSVDSVDSVDSVAKLWRTFYLFRSERVD